MDDQIESVWGILIMGLGLVLITGILWYGASLIDCRRSGSDDFPTEWSGFNCFVQTKEGLVPLQNWRPQ